MNRSRYYRPSSSTRAEDRRIQYREALQAGRVRAEAERGPAELPPLILPVDKTPVTGLGGLEVFPDEVIIIILENCTLRAVFRLMRVNKKICGLAESLHKLDVTKQSVQLILGRAKPFFQDMMKRILKIVTFERLRFLLTTHLCERCGDPPASFRMSRSAWTLEQAEIDGFVRGCSERRISTAYIESPHGTGKSTTLLTHIFTVAQKVQPGVRVVYLLPTSTEATLLENYLSSEKFKSSQEEIRDTELAISKFMKKGTLTLMSFSAFNLDFSPLHPQPPTIFLIDVEVHPSTDGELAFGYLLDWADTLDYEPSDDDSMSDDELYSERPLGNGIIALGPCRSQRTMQGFSDWVSHEPKNIVIVPSAMPEVIPERVKGEWLDVVQEVVKGCNDSQNPSENRVLVSTPWQYSASEGDGLGHCFLDSLSELREVLDGHVAVTVNPLMGFSTARPGLRTFLSQSVIEDTVFDEETGQFVLCQRLMTQEELKKDQGWVLKSGHASQVKFLTYYNPKKIHKRDEGIDSPGDAYGRNLLWTVLRLVHLWPDTRLQNMPIRPVVDIPAVLESFRRLKRMGCIESSTTTPHGFTVTELGCRVKDCPQLLLTPETDIYTSRFLASLFVNGREWSDNLKRVIIRMASIVACGIDKICRLLEPAEVLDARALRRHCAGMGAQFSHRGAMWIALALYQEIKMKGVHAQAITVLRDDLEINQLRIMNAIKLTGKLEEGLNLVGPPHELQNTILTSAELDIVEEQLMIAWMHRMVYISNTSYATDLISGTRFRICRWGGMLDIERALRENNNQGIFAIYFTLEKIPNADVYAITHLTAVPNRVMTVIEGRPGVPFMSTWSRYPKITEEYIT
ncbi:hypothetical protein F4778DRAFT_798486 [Xylariomycetidae sp. FL2044]|nr:hypothetical protein F4778DRAFT_798486 [Xylariomycetidae sp. FL2044]